MKEWLKAKNQSWTGPLLTILAGLIMSAIALLTGYHLPLATAIFLLIIVYAAFRGGLFSSLASVGLAIGYFTLEIFIPGGLLNFGEQDIERLAVLSLSAPLMALLVAKLKQRAEQALLLKLKQEQEYSATLKQLLEKQQQTDQEIQRLNSGLEEQVRERTAQLQESEERFRLLSEASFEGIVIHEGGQVVEANQVLADIFGYQLDEFKQLSYRELIAPEDIPLIIQKIASGDTSPYEATALKKDGSRFAIEGQPKNITFKGRPLRVMAIRDITQRRRQEQLLSQKQQQLQAILDNSTTNIFLKDREGRYLLINRQIERLFGLKLSEVTGKTDQELFPEDYVEQWNANDREVLSSGQALEMEEEVFQADGRHTYISIKFPLLDEKGEVYALGGISTDITDRKRAEGAIKASQARLAGIIESAMDAIITLNAKHKITAFNLAAEKLFGCSSQEVLGQTLDRFIPQHFQAIHNEPVTAFGQTDNTSRSMGLLTELYALRADGQEFPIEATISQIEADGEKFYTLFIRDVTERVQAYRLLEQRVAERTIELSTLLEISHNVTGTFELKSMAELLLVQLGQLLKYDAALLTTYENGKFKLIDALVNSQRPPLELLAPLVTQPPRFKEVAEAKKSLIIEDLAKDNFRLNQAGERAKVDLSYMHCGLFVPLLVKDRLVGMLVMTQRTVGYFTPHHAELAQAIANQVAIAIENARLYEQAQSLAALEERQRLARELHDSTSQVLYSIQLGSRATRNFLKQGQIEQANESLDYVISLAKGGLDEMRALIFELRPESLAREGLLGALQKQVVSLQARHGLEVVTKLSQATEPDLPLHYKEALYRIAREALHNVVKHAETTKVELAMNWNEQEIQLLIRDYGNGFNTKAEYPGHFGLHSMTERVKRLSGNISIESSPGKGTTIRVVIPNLHYSELHPV